MAYLAYGAVAIAALYTHYYAALLIGAAAVAWLATALVRRDRPRLLTGLGVHALIGLAFVPWVPVAMDQARLATRLGRTVRDRGVHDTVGVDSQRLLVADALDAAHDRAAERHRLRGPGVRGRESPAEGNGGDRDEQPANRA